MEHDETIRTLATLINEALPLAKRLASSPIHAHLHCMLQGAAIDFYRIIALSIAIGSIGRSHPLFAFISGSIPV